MCWFESSPGHLLKPCTSHVRGFFIGVSASFLRFFPLSATLFDPQMTHTFLVKTAIGWSALAAMYSTASQRQESLFDAHFCHESGSAHGNISHHAFETVKNVFVRFFVDVSSICSSRFFPLHKLSAGRLAAQALNIHLPTSKTAAK